MRGEWEDVAVGILPARAEALADDDDLEAEEQEREAEESAWLGLS